MVLRSRAVGVIALALCSFSSFAQFDTGGGSAPKNPVGSTERLLEPIQFRNAGVAMFGGRVLDIESPRNAPNTVYVGAATGGLFKSINNGTTWTPIFDNYGSVSIGDLAIAPSNPDILYLGTGENTSTRSAHYGDGVYKSTDAGKTWTNLGLKESKRIGQIAIDPKNPDVVYVASMGYLYKSGGEKGLYKTTDGGKTWTQVLKGDNDTTGFIDVVLDPKNPKVVYAASHDRLRRAWTIRESGPGAAIYKSTDAGKTWKKLAGGLPTGNDVGRIGLAVAAKDSSKVYAFIDMKGQGGGGQLFRSNDGGNKWTKVNETRLSGGSYYCHVFVDPNDPETIWCPNVSLMRSKDGGKTFQGVGTRAHVDWHSVWINPADSNQVRAGCDGGLYFSYDAMETTWHINNLPIAQFYMVSTDNAVPYHVMGGTQDNGSWRGPSQSQNRGGVFNWQWESILGGDGFYNLANPKDPDTIYGSSQFGAVTRVDMKDNSGKSIRPRDTAQRANWMAPFATSSFAPDTLYWGGNKLYKSLDRGDTWKTISPDLTTNDPEKIKGNVPHCTITTIEESRKKQGLVWVGTDDGNVWITQDDGGNWTKVNDNMTGAPKGYWVSRVIASPHAEGTAFVTFTGFREDDWNPYVFKTTDFGKTWTKIEGLPNEQVSVIRQDAVNPDLLFVGTEAGLYVSIDGGAKWNRLNVGVQSVPCQDLVIQERESDLVVGTHGRGIYIADIAPYRQLTKDILTKDQYLFKPTRALNFNFTPSQFEAFQGFQRFSSPNPQFGASIWYYLKADAKDDPKIEILDIAGTVLATLKGSKTAGLNKSVWNLRSTAGAAQGKYLVRLTVGSDVQTQVLTVEALGKVGGANRDSLGKDDDDGDGGGR
jgi:photosystem II stability/assembly factor-like uncharacterized protein